tara:strand:+ start:1058 stop:1231 length:174 start_codon:yes stop_codon:yes gene_type:complete
MRIIYHEDTGRTESFDYEIIEPVFTEDGKNIAWFDCFPTKNSFGDQIPADEVKAIIS